ncbi:unnamed protein product [Effrenium voratum]|nr:unnamed protein product [Effrenium voratum]
MWSDKPPDWEVCWDFANRQKQNAWQGSGSYQSQESPWQQSLAWQQMQMQQMQQLQMQQMQMPPWAPSPDAWYTPQQQLRQAQASSSSARPDVDLPPSLEKRMKERESRAAAPEPPDKDFEGVIKSLSERHGYGFISCDEVHRLYGRDSYVPKDLIPDGAQVQDQVTFRIGLSPKGHPQVTRIERAVPSPE